MRSRPARLRGFTLIELLVVLAIVALLLTLALPRYVQNIDLGKEIILKDNLHTTRRTIDQFRGDTGRYPQSLQELVERHYLHAMPVDPVTDSTTTWVLTAPEDNADGGVADLHSGAPGTTRDGKAFADL